MSLEARDLLADRYLFEQRVRPFLRELQVHCYRMLGAVHEAEDATQDTLMRAWRKADTIRDVTSIRAWLYAIATNVCLDALAARPRRPLPSSVLSPADPRDEPPGPGEDRWLHPYPDALLGEDGDPAMRVATRETISIAFMVAVQALAPRQRAVLLLREVLGFSAAEVGEMLGMSPVSVHSAMQRARARLDAVPVPDPPTADQERIVERYVRALEQADVAQLIEIVREDASMTMPPDPAWFRGRDAILAFLDTWVFGPRGGLVVRRTRANRQPAVLLLERAPDGSEIPLAVQILHIENGMIVHIAGHVGAGLFPAFEQRSAGEPAP